MAKKLPEEKKELARALLETGMSYREVSSALAISVASVHNISREPLEDLAPLVAEIRKRMASKCWLLADHILSKLGNLSIASATLKEKTIAAAILTDKAVLLEKEVSALEHDKPKSGRNDKGEG